MPLVYLLDCCWTLLQHVQGRLHTLHRFQHRWIEHFYVALLGDVRFGVAQNPLHDLIVRTQLVQVGCDPTTETMPPVPGQPNGINRWTIWLLARIAEGATGCASFGSKDLWEILPTCHS